MTDAKTKDAIWQACSKVGFPIFTKNIAQHLSVPHFTVVTLCKEMEQDDNIELIPVDTTDWYMIVRKQKGEHFFYKSSYTKKAFWKNLEDLPKRYGVIALLVTSLGFNVKDAIQYFGHRKSHQSKTESVQQSKATDTSHRR